MSKKNPDTPLRPTEAELGILRSLWKSGPATVRQVHESMKGRQEGYTTILKLLQIMHQKGLVTRDESQRAHVYTAVVEKDQAQEQLLGDLVQRVFDGSRSQLVLQALGTNEKTSPEELQQIRDLLDELEKRARETKGGSDHE